MLSPERLREIRNAVEGAANSVKLHGWASKVRDLLAEVDRLRVALDESETRAEQLASDLRGAE